MALHKKSVLIKTDRGREALVRRLSTLPVRLRPLLIWVDGQRTVAELAHLGKALGGVEALQLLVELGMVALPAATTSATASRSAVASDGAAKPVPTPAPAKAGSAQLPLPSAAPPVAPPAEAPQREGRAPSVPRGTGELLGGAGLQTPPSPLRVQPLAVAAAPGVLSSDAETATAAVPSVHPSVTLSVPPLDAEREPAEAVQTPSAGLTAETGGGSAGPTAAQEVPPVAMTLDDYKARVVAFFEAELGPAADTLVAQIRACSTRRDLKPLLLRGMDNLRYFKGATAAAEFEQGLGRLLPRR